MKTIPQEELINEHGECVYSNFDHRLIWPLVRDLISKEGKACSQHAARNFCGYIWFKRGKFYEQVRQNHTPVDDFRDENIRLLIERVNAKYGNE